MVVLPCSDKRELKYRSCGGLRAGRDHEKKKIAPVIGKGVAGTEEDKGGKQDRLELLWRVG